MKRFYAIQIIFIWFYAIILCPFHFFFLALIFVFVALTNYFLLRWKKPLQFSCNLTVARLSYLRFSFNSFFLHFFFLCVVVVVTRSPSLLCTLRVVCQIRRKSETNHWSCEYFTKYISNLKVPKWIYNLTICAMCFFFFVSSPWLCI